LLLHELIEALPEPIKVQYEKTVRRSTTLQERLKVCSALELWRRGHRKIEFEKPLQLGGGKLAYIDVYAGEGPVAVECETVIQAGKLRRRAWTIRRVLPEVSVVLAVPDWLAAEANVMVEVFDEVWAVQMNGKVTDSKTALINQRKRLEELLNPPGLKRLLEQYQEIETCLKEHTALRESIRRVARDSLKVAARLLLGEKNSEQLLDIEVEVPVLDQEIDGFRRWAQDIKAEITAKIVDLANELLCRDTELVLTLKKDKGKLKCLVRRDDDLSEWHGLTDKPIIL